MRTLCVLLLGLTAWSGASSMSFVPTVYRDDFVTVNAGIVDASQRLPRVGSVLTLHIAVQFSADNTVVSELDDAFFERMFANQPAVRLLGSTGERKTTQAGGMAVVENDWQFQILGCPDTTSNCPGTRVYALPITILDYSVMGRADGRPSQRSARFRPWPESLSLVSAFPAALPEDADIDDWVAGGAMPMPALSQDASSLAPLLVAAGLALLLLSFINPGAGRGSSATPQVNSAARWRQVARSLDDAGLSDAEWLDRYRRCLVWYLTDEKGVNPYALSARANDSVAASLLADILQRVSADDRQHLIERLHDALGLNQAEAVSR